MEENADSGSEIDMDAAMNEISSDLFGVEEEAPEDTSEEPQETEEASEEPIEASEETSEETEESPELPISLQFPDYL